MNRLIMAIFFITGCHVTASTLSRHASIYSISDSFEDLATSAHHWKADLIKNPRAYVNFVQDEGNNVLSLKLSAHQDAQDLIVHRSIDLVSVRGQRVRLSVRVRTPGSKDARAHVRLSVIPSSGEQTYSDFVDSVEISNDKWTTAYIVIDVNDAATRGEIALALRGSGTAWFDDVRLIALGRSPKPDVGKLAEATRERLVTLAHAIALVRYFHPSDESATIDWETFSTRAIESLLRTRDELPMQGFLTRIFAHVAPTVLFVASGDRRQATLPRDSRATHLVRWHHVGYGIRKDDDAYISFRDGIDEDENASTYAYSVIRVPHLASCKKAEVRATLRSAVGSPLLQVTMNQPGYRQSYIREAISPERSSGPVFAHGDVPADVEGIQLGIYLENRSSVEISNISFQCENGDIARVDETSAWELSRSQDLFRKETTRCGTGFCLRISRVPRDTELQLDRDIADVDIGSGLHMKLPLTVWSDGKVTFPRVSAEDLPPPDYAIADLSVRLAAVASTWSTLLWFYPYFRDLHFDWLPTLSRAFDEVAVASSPTETHIALSRLVARLQDGHAHVRHPTRSMQGMLPFSLRQFDGKLFIIGGLPDYMASIPVGSELKSVDGISVNTLYNDNLVAVSAATSQFRDYLASLYVSLGAIGSLKRITLTTPQGVEMNIVLPLVSRQLFGDEIHEKRPKSGTEIASSIFYIDPVQLDQATLPGLIQTLRPARAVVVDLRGYIKNTAIEFLAHFISHAVPSPVLRTPIVSVLPDTKYEDEGWLLWPAVPFLGCRMVVLTDTRAVSAAETLLQMIRDNHLATFVGEPTAGTNGSVNMFTVAGGFEIRFTGMHVSAPDGSTIHGHGIVPDQIVHPTLEGIRTGRDEILEAGIATAQRLAPQ